jgi:hypothetical protein
MHSIGGQASQRIKRARVVRHSLVARASLHVFAILTETNMLQRLSVERSTHSPSAVCSGEGISGTHDRERLPTHHAEPKAIMKNLRQRLGENIC